jgi:hypothetical protein
VKPYRKDFGLPGTPRPTSDPAHPLGDEVLKHLEEWGCQDQGDDLGDWTLGDEVLEHLEESSCGDPGDGVGDLNSPAARSEPTRTLPPLPSDRAHPLWDRDLDG